MSLNDLKKLAAVLSVSAIFLVGCDNAAGENGQDQEQQQEQEENYGDDGAEDQDD